MAASRSAAKASALPLFDAGYSVLPTLNPSPLRGTPLSSSSNPFKAIGTPANLEGKTIEDLFIHVRAIRRMPIAQSDRAARSIVDHMRIIEALEARDTERAERLVRQHSLDLAEHVDAHGDFLD